MSVGHLTCDVGPATFNLHNLQPSTNQPADYKYDDTQGNHYQPKPGACKKRAKQQAIGERVLFKPNVIMMSMGRAEGQRHVSVQYGEGEGKRKNKCSHII